MKSRRNFFIESSLWIAAKAQSKRYIRTQDEQLKHPDGSSSWYTRQAVIEKLLRDDSRIGNLENCDFTIAEKRK